MTRPHGLQGMLNVQLHWEGSSSLFEVGSIELELESGERRTFEIESRQRTGKGLLVKFKGIDDRTAADALRGARLFVPREALPPLEDGEAYLVDLVGATVHAPDGLVGQVTRVQVNPSVDSLIIACPDGREVELALMPAFVARIDAGAKRIELHNRDGFIE